MKTSLILIFLFCGINSYSQDAARISYIDSLVRSINKINLQVYKDSSTQKLPDSETIMKVYTTSVFDDSLLKKYQFIMRSTDNRNGIYTAFTQSRAYYYDQNQLIKVEESRLQFEVQSDITWYYSNDKLLSCTENDTSRSASLLSNAKEFLKQAERRKKR